MIPLRVYVKGFMCYRDEAEICFRNSTLWALCGLNGHGKSALFDAMCYVLYKEHRLGKQNTEELIHREAQEFIIEFDFALGTNEYRVRRTYSRKKRGTTQAFHLSGPDAPNPGRPGPQPIPDTESDPGFTRWVLQTIGLDEKTFTVSVLLLQGKSDALLKLGGAQRHDVLTKIIDLSRYDSIYRRAHEHSQEEEKKVKLYKQQIGSLEPVDEARVSDMERQIGEIRVNKEAERERQLILTGLREQAKRWESLQKDAGLLTEKLATYRRLLDQAPRIEQRASRLDDLQKVVPLLVQIYSKQRAVTFYQGQVEQGRIEMQSLNSRLQMLAEKLDAAQQLFSTLQIQRTQADEEQKGLQPCLHDLESAFNEIKQLRDKQQKYQQWTQKLASYPSDLEQQQQRLQEQYNQLEQLSKAYPYLKAFVQARWDWQQATRKLFEIHRQQSLEEAHQEEAAKRRQIFQDEIKALDDQLSNINSELSSRKTLRDECKKRLNRFQSIGGKPTCDYCGQRLTEEHLAAERQLIEDELQEKQRLYQEIEKQQKDVQRKKETLQQNRDQALQAEEQCKQTIKKLREEQNRVQSLQSSARGRAEGLLSTLLPEHVAQMQGADLAGIDIDICLQSAYPQSQEMDALAKQLLSMGKVKQQLQKVIGGVEAYNEGACQKRYLLNDLQPLEQAYPSERIEALLQERQQGQKRNKHLLKILKDLDKDIKQQEKQIGDLDAEKQTAERDKSQAEQNIAVATTNFQNAQREVGERKAVLPATWHAQSERLSELLLQDLQNETKKLEGSDKDKQALEQAGQIYAHDQQRINDLKKELEQIPQEAQRASAQIQEEVNQAESSYQQLEMQERLMSAKISHLQQIQKQRATLDQQLAEAPQLASRYKELERLLGRDHLQHYLVQKAEAGIVYHANEALDRLSGGMLRLELRSNTERKTDALDLVAYNRAVGDSLAQRIDSLSGSQKFRVAVSLALGIGRYAGNDNHRVESIIIDEGFGSLDEKGRREMIQALQEWGEVLKCIIVVSHQREFFDEFPNKYLVELVEGSTQVSLM
jgi:DNA repair exonuclease SbcCD ATPase subunit